MQRDYYSYGVIYLNVMLSSNYFDVRDIGKMVTHITQNNIFTTARLCQSIIAQVLNW